MLNEIIKKIGKNKWRLYSKDMSRNLGTFSSLAAAKKHEREVQYFKHKMEEQFDGNVKLFDVLFEGYEVKETTGIDGGEFIFEPNDLSILNNSSVIREDRQSDVLKVMEAPSKVIERLGGKIISDEDYAPVTTISFYETISVAGGYPFRRGLNVEKVFYFEKYYPGVGNMNEAKNVFDVDIETLNKTVEKVTELSRKSFNISDRVSRYVRNETKKKVRGKDVVVVDGYKVIAEITYTFEYSLPGSITISTYSREKIPVLKAKEEEILQQETARKALNDKKRNEFLDQSKSATAGDTPEIKKLRQIMSRFAFSIQNNEPLDYVIEKAISLGYTQNDIKKIQNFVATSDIDSLSAWTKPINEFEELLNQLES